VPVYPDGGVGEPICEPAPEPVVYSQCEPPYSNYYGYAGGGVAYGEGTPGDNTGTSGAPVGALPPSEGPGTVELPGEDPTAPGDVMTVAGGSSESQDGGGCQVRTGRVNGIAGFLLAALGLFAASRRRSVRP
jgi:hypothetical protein